MGEYIEQPQRCSLPFMSSPDGRLVIVGCRDGTVRVWDKATGTPIGPSWHHDHEGAVWNLACDPGGATVWSVSDDKTVRQWQLPSAIEGDPQQITKWTQFVTGMTFDQHHTAHWVDAATWQRLRQELRKPSSPRLR